MRRRVAALLLLAAACAPRTPATDAAAVPAADAAASEQVVVTLERGPCYGACPVYSLAIAAGGEVRFQGTRHTARLGEATRRIPPARVDSLLGELKAGGYLDFADVYEPGTPGCGRAATDLPSVTTSVVIDGGRKEIRHYYGCEDAPRALTALERRIDAVAEAAEWVGVR